jgi:hypothetical protein
MKFLVPKLDVLKRAESMHVNGGGEPKYNIFDML